MLGYRSGRVRDQTPTVTHSPHATPRYQDVTILDWVALRRGTVQDAGLLLAQILLTDNCYRLPGETTVHRLDSLTRERILTAYRVPTMSSAPTAPTGPSVLCFTGAPRALNASRAVPLMRRFSAD